MRKRALLALGIIALLIIGAVGYFSLVPQSTGLPTVELKGETIRVSIANTDALRSKGLGGRDGLASDEGMLFVFPQTGREGFWMKDMRFPIDILWISEAKKIVYMVQSVSPETYPEVFTPGLPARYVLELPAGWAKAHGVQIGDSATF